ncbi:hypothetical protein BRD19_11675 [Halobacteriales archaeon SW_7_65_23]|nr:MAG: hypothetical protein BRD19_11675 [Halobacteriales archaeon SW_7_65_23]
MTRRDTETERFDKLVRDHIPGIIEELADVLEVVHALRAEHGVSAERLAEIREEKAAERGRFADGIVLDAVESPAGTE